MCFKLKLKVLFDFWYAKTNNKIKHWFEVKMLKLICNEIKWFCSLIGSFSHLLHAHICILSNGEIKRKMLIEFWLQHLYRPHRSSQTSLIGWVCRFFIIIINDIDLKPCIICMLYWKFSWIVKLLGHFNFLANYVLAFFTSILLHHTLSLSLSKILFYSSFLFSHCI